MNRKYIPVIILFLLCCINPAFAQQPVSGTVVSAADSKPIPFVTVSIAGTTLATATDIDGNFSLQNVSPDDTLMFTFVGYISQKIKAGTQKVFMVKLQPGSTNLDEVVVTALGITRQKRELGYATEKIGGNEIIKSNSPNILNAITGKSAGVQIINADGVDGGTTGITIRGNSSISGKNQPLIVVDGIPLNNDPGLTDVGRGQDWGSAINNINMMDVEDVNILKGGAASALYGARGANGVILITMKKGRKQNGLGVLYSMTYRKTHPYMYRDVQNKYGGGAPSTSYTPPDFNYAPDGTPMMPSLATDAQFGYPGSAVSWGPAFNDQNILWWDSVMRPWSAQPGNLKIPFRDGLNVTHNVSVEGGGSLGSLRFSITRTDNTPIVRNSNFKETTISTNSGINVSDKVKIDLSLAYTDYKRLNSPMLGEASNAFTKGLLYSWPRSYAGEDLTNYELPDGTRNLQEGFPYMYIDRYMWWNYYNNNTTLDRTKILGGFSLNYTITSWLTLTGRTGIDYTIDKFQTKNKPADLVGLKDGYYGEKSLDDRSYNHEFLFTATKKKIFKTDINAAFNIGGAAWNRNMHAVSAHSGTWYYPNWYSLSNFTPLHVTGVDQNGLPVVQGDDPALLIPKTDFLGKKINSVYSFLDLSFRDYLFLQITGRNDWSSTLPENSNSYFFPGISAGFIASEAFKFKNKRFSFCKIRVNAAQTATDTDPYRTEFYYTTGLFGSDQSSTFPNLIPPIALKPQRVNSYEAGINLGFFDDKITLDFTYYYDTCFDQIIALPVPVSSGAPMVGTNEGVLTNRGIEIILSATVLNKKNFVVKTGLNFTRNRNRVEDLGGNADVLKIADIWDDNGPAMALREGDYFGTIYGWDYVYKNGQRVVSDDGKLYELTETQVPIGNAAPDFLAGWTTELRFKNFSLRTLIDTKWGGDIYCGSYVIGLQTGQSPETLLERDGGGLPFTDAQGNTTNTGVILEGVHADGTPNTTVVSYYYKYLPNAGGWGHFLSTPGIVENTWVKFREATLSYTLPEKFLSKQKILREFSLSFTARDLFYIYTTLPDNINPEGIRGAGDAQAFEWASLPGVRSFSFGINARF